MSETRIMEAQEAQPIPTWTRDDFNTERPYAWLYGQQKDRFFFQQMMNRVRDNAREVKFSGFTKMWELYVSSMRANAPTVVGINDTNFPYQPIQLQCGEYICDETGVSYTGRMGEHVDVCYHPIMPVKRYINMDSGERKTELSYFRDMADGKPVWDSIIVSRETIASSQKVIGLSRYGISVNSETAKEFVKYLEAMENLNYSALPLQKSTSHMGWLPNGEFAPYCEHVAYDGNDPECQQVFNSFAEKGSEEVWMNLAREVRNSDSVPARIALAASFAAPLVKPLDALPFFVHFWGASGCGKSVGLMLAASVWADPEIGKYIKTFHGTKVHQERMAALCCNVPVIIDELQVISDRKLFDDIIYSLCEGVSKGRGTKDGGMQLQSRWATCILTSGEMPMVQGSSGGGAASRAIEISYGGEPFFKDARAVASTLKANYGWAGKKFVQAISDKDTIALVRKLQDKYYSELVGSIQEKQVLAASILLAADRVASHVLFGGKEAGDRPLTVEDIRPYLITKEQADPNQRCYNWLVSYVVGNMRRFESDDNNGEQWGVYEFDKSCNRYVAYFLRPFFDKALQNGGFSPGSFLAWAKLRGKIKFFRQDSNYYRKTINNARVNCIAVIMPDLEDGDPITPIVSGHMERVDTDDMPF